MSEVGPLSFARVGWEGPRRSSRPHSCFSKYQFNQPQLLAVLCLMRYEDWAVREAEIRLGMRAG